MASPKRPIYVNGIEIKDPWDDDLKAMGIDVYGGGTENNESPKEKTTQEEKNDVPLTETPKSKDKTPDILPTEKNKTNLGSKQRKYAKRSGIRGFQKDKYFESGENRLKRLASSLPPLTIYEIPNSQHHLPARVIVSPPPVPNLHIPKKFSAPSRKISTRSLLNCIDEET